jgi:cytochrome c oxidase cbb3-type subunit 3
MTDARTVRGHRPLWLGLGLLVLGAAALVLYWLPQRALAAELLRSDPATLLKNPRLVNYALGVARPQFAAHCASCHGEQGQGNQPRGVPSLADKNWLYGNELVDLEQIVLYGIRSGHPKARNLTDMPALGRIGQITAADTEDVLEYLLLLGGRATNAAAAARGKAIFLGKGACYDCHSADARGVTDYGTPALDGSGWTYGGDRQTLYSSIFNGRHGKCPAWWKTLSPVQARAMAVLLREGVAKRG